MGRLSELEPARMPPHQRQVYERIASGPRQGVIGPLAVWLHAPGLAEKAEALGVYCRFESSLSPRLNEIAILIVVAHWHARFAWHRHRGLARNAGLDDAAIEAIRTGVEPRFEDHREQAVYDFTNELMASKSVGDATWAKTVAALGETSTVDLIGIAGYYAMVAMTIVASGLGADEPDPWK